MLKNTNISNYGYTGSSPFRRSGDEVVEGNVITVFSDRKIAQDIDADGVIDSYKAILLTSMDYTPFGMQMADRGLNNNIGLYRFGFNGKENDNEVKGVGNQQDYGFRIYDSRIGKFLSVDPLTQKYPELTPYQFASNTPIMANDLDGLEANVVIAGQGNRKSAYDKPPDDVGGRTVNEIEVQIAKSIAKKTKGNVEKVHTGQSIINLLSSKTKQEGSVGFVTINSHGFTDGLILNWDAGLLSDDKNYGSKQPGAAKIKDIKSKMNSGGIKFTKDATIVLGACYTDNTPIKGNSFAYNLTKELGVTTIATNGSVSFESNDGTKTFTGNLISKTQWYKNERIEVNYLKEKFYYMKSTPVGKQNSDGTYTINPNDFKPESVKNKEK